MPFTQYRQSVTDRVERQRPQPGLDPGRHQRRVDAGRQQVRPVAVGQRPRQVVEDELNRYRGRQRRIPERLTVT